MSYINTTFIAALFLCASSLPAQSIWTLRGENSNIEVEYLHPLFKDNSLITSTEIITLSARVTTGSTTSIIFELPWISSGISSNFFGETSQSAIGNPYLGLLFESDKSIVFGELGIRPPLMSEHSTTAAVAGITGDFDRFEAFTPQVFQAVGALNLKPALGQGFAVRLRIGPSFDFSTRSGGGSEVLINYGAILIYGSETVDAGAGIVGRASTSSGSSSNPTIDQLEGSLRLHIDNFHPAIQLRTPLDDGLRAAYDLEFGINLAIEF